MSIRSRLADLAWRATGRARLEDELSEEIRFHIDAAAEELERGGVPRDEARRQARLRFGAVEKYKEEGREAFGWRPLDELRADVRDTVRGLKRDPGFGFVAVVVIAAALSANTVLLAFLDEFFLRPLPIEGASRHVELEVRTDRNETWSAWPLGELEGVLRQDNPALEHAYGFGIRRAIVGGADPKRAYAEVVTPGYFELRRLRPRVGRLPRANAGAWEPSLLLSHGGWEHLTGSDPAPLGKTLFVDGLTMTIVGVLENGEGSLEPVTPEFWMLAGAPSGPGRGPDQRYNVSGLLREGVSAERARALLRSQLPPEPPGGGSGRVVDVRLEPRTTLLRESRELQPLAITLVLLFGLVTLVAAANLTSLHLARATARRQDLSIRAALGASRSRLVRHLVTESVIVAAVAGVLSWAVAAASVGWVQGSVFTMVADAGLSMQPLAIGPRIVAANFALALVVGVGCGLLPALQTTRMHRTLSLKRDATWLGAGVTSNRVRGALVVAQVALSLPLLVGSLILMRGASAAGRVDTGYRVGGLLDLRGEPTTRRLLDRVLATPGVETATAVRNAPLTGDDIRTGARLGTEESPIAFNQVDERFFTAMGIDVVAGRGFLESETAAQAPVVIVSESAARRLWPGGAALGQAVEILTIDGSDTYTRREVVGVARDAISGWFFRGRERPIVYAPGSIETGLSDIVVRVDDSSPAVANLLRRTCADAGSFCEPFPLTRALAMQRLPFLIAGLVASSLGGLALGLACLGLHGLVRFAVAQRRREFGVRLALGASRALVLRGVLQESLRRVAHGLAIGLPVCFAISAFIASKVRLLSWFDPVAYGSVALALLAASLLASLMPALRAAGTDPIRALREE